MTKKRANGTGFITRRGRGWICQLSHGRDPNTGKRRRVFFHGSTYKEVADKLATFTASIDTTCTVGEWLEHWSKTYLIDRRTTTRERYVGLVVNHLIPQLGSVKLNELTPDHIATMQAALSDRLSEKTRELVHAVLSRALKQAVQSGKAYRNVMQACTKARAEQGDHRILSKDQFSKFLDAARESKYWLTYCIIASSGLRRGEALGLKWSDVSFDRCQITVRETIVKTSAGLEVNPPKTKQSRRTVPLPEWVMSALAEVPVSKRQGLIAKSVTGGPVHPDRLLHEFHRMMERAGLPRMVIHELRHTHASLLIHDGLSLSDIARRLGHSTIRTTGDIYGHEVPSEADKAVKVLNNLYSGGNKPNESVSGTPNQEE